MKCYNCIHYDVCDYHIDEETTELTVNECSHGFKHRDQYIELPVYVGQPVWRLISRYNWTSGEPRIIGYDIEECKVSMLQQKVDKSWKFRISRNGSVGDYKLEDLNNCIYTNPKDAEAERIRRIKEINKET